MALLFFPRKRQSFYHPSIYSSSPSSFLQGACPALAKSQDK